MYDFLYIVFINLSIFFLAYFKKLALNVPAVYDVWAGIKGLCAASLPQEARPPAQMCRNEAWEGAKRLT